MGVDRNMLATAIVATLLLVSCGDDDDSSPTASVDQCSGGLPGGAGQNFPIAITDCSVIDEWTEDQLQDYSRTDSGSGIVTYQRLEPPVYGIQVTRDDKHGGELYTRLDAVAASQ
jgi:hypothetical protein